MIVDNLEKLKSELQKVLVEQGFIEFCQNCPVPVRCCKYIKPTCDYVINKCDCSENKPLECYFFVCPVVNKKNPEVNNWLMRIRGSITWPNKLEFPFEMEDFKESNKNIIP